MIHLVLFLLSCAVTFVFSFLPITAFAAKDSQGNEIIKKEILSSIGWGYESINEADKNLDKVGIETTIVTSYGGFKILGNAYGGEQTIFPEWSNIVTNGGQDIGTYDFEKGSLGVLGGGYGIDKVWKDLRTILKYSGFLVDGETNIASDVVGHMSRKGSGFNAHHSLLDVASDLGVSASFYDGDIVEVSRFFEGRSTEEIDSEKYTLGARVPLIFNKVSVDFGFAVLNETSDVSYRDGSPGALLIPRKVSGSENTLSLGGVFYYDFLSKDYWKFLLSIVSGDTRHEFTSAELEGFGIRLERGFGNKGEGNFLEPAVTFFLEGNYRESSSRIRYRDNDPATNIPIGLNFTENRQEWTVAAGYDSIYWAADICYTNFEKNGSTIIDVPALGGVIIPFADGELALETISLGTQYDFTEKLQGRVDVNTELNFGETSVGLTLTYFFNAVPQLTPT